MSTAAVPSPCTGVCRIDARTALCAGCSRTLDEIATWSRLSDEAKSLVWADLPRRRADGGDALATTSRT